MLLSSLSDKKKLSPCSRRNGFASGETLPKEHQGMNKTISHAERLYLSQLKTCKISCRETLPKCALFPSPYFDSELPSYRHRESSSRKGSVSCTRSAAPWSCAGENYVAWRFRPPYSGSFADEGLTLASLRHFWLCTPIAPKRPESL